MDTRHVETNRDIVRTHLTHSIDGRGTWCQDGLTQGFSMLAVQKNSQVFPKSKGLESWKTVKICIIGQSPQDLQCAQMSPDHRDLMISKQFPFNRNDTLGFEFTSFPQEIGTWYNFSQYWSLNHNSHEPQDH